MDELTRGSDRHIILDGLRFHYRDWPQPNRPPLLLLHGFSQRASWWDAIARELQRDFRVLALDQRGHGDSAWSSAYPSESWVTDITAFVDALQLAPVTLVGHSMGGVHACAYAALHPDAVTRLVIVDIGPPDPARWRGGAGRYEPAQVWYAIRQTLRHRRADLRLRLRHLLRDYDPRLRLPARDAAAEWANLARIPCPTLIVRGAESQALKQDTARQMLRVLPQGTLVEIADAGHLIHWEQPERLIAALRAFLVTV
jgi:pimeloyl-ACP methyl ester carboxylesterase